MKHILLILSLLLGLANTLHAEDSIGTTTLFGGAYNDVKNVGNYAYVASGAGLKVIDVSNPATPQLVAKYDTNDSANGIDIFGNKAYLATNKGLLILDVSTPSNPSFVSQYGISKYYGVDAAGDYVYIASGSAGLVVLNVFDPTAPTLSGTYETIGYTGGVSVLGNYAYVADPTSGLKIIDISNPAAPTFSGTYDTTGRALGVSVLGNYAYVADGLSGLQIIDISIPAAPTLSGTYDTTGDARGVSVLGNYAYVADSSAGLQIIDISTPAAPTHSGTYDTTGSARGVSVLGNYAYVADSSAGLQIINITDPTTPTLSGTYDTTGFAYGVSVLGNYAYVADGSAGLSIVKVQMTDTDNDGVPDVTDTDDDNDGVLDNADAFPLNANESVDTDGDGTGNNADTDDDNNGISDADEIAHGLNPLDVSDATADADGDGISNADEIQAGTDPQVANLTDVEKFVKRFYEVILGRTPDSAGLVDWSSKLEGLSKSGADIAKGFIFSAEYNIDSKSDTEYLNTLYSAFFDRAGDTGRLAYWHNQIALGASRTDVLDGFLNSLEFINLAESYGIIANATPVELFVSRFYKQTLLRNPDAAGLADWTNRLNTGIASGSDVAFGFVFSNEFIARNLNNNDFVTVLYRAFFGREPDTVGFNGWMTQLNAGTTRKAVLQGFLGAVEFANLAGEYGIRVR